MNFKFLLIILLMVKHKSYAIDLAGASSDFNMLKAALSNTCWKDSYTRGPGYVLTKCRGNDEQSGELCYGKCDFKFNGLGPICWEKCKTNYTDRGAFCIIDIDIYAKKCCCTLFSKNCCGTCKPGYVDDGCFCRRPPVSYPKKSYGRGAGYSLGCRRNEEQNGGLCYPKCEDNYYGEGPVCYKRCFGTTGADCGAFCAKSQTDCRTKLEQLVNNPIVSTLNLVKSSDNDRTQLIGNTIMKMLQAYLFFKC